MKVLVTSGPTIEKIDTQTVIKSVSTGELGSIIADKFAFFGNEVSYIYGKDAMRPKNEYIELRRIWTGEDAKKEISHEAKKSDVIIHVMNVCKWKVPKELNKTSDLQSHLTINAPILPSLRGWCSKGKIVGFMFEPNGEETLLESSTSCLSNNMLDYVVGVSRTELIRENQYVAYIIGNNNDVYKCYGKDDIAEKLYWCLK